MRFMYAEALKMFKKMKMCVHKLHPTLTTRSAIKQQPMIECSWNKRQGSVLWIAVSIWNWINFKDMACLEQKSFLNFPDEIIEHILAFLSFNDLYNVGKVEKRLEDCAKRVLEKKPPFSKCIFDLIKLSCNFYKYYHLIFAELLFSNHISRNCHPWWIQ